MKVMDVAQRSEAWLQWRRQGLGASEAAIIMNRSPYLSPWRLWAEKTGLVLAAQLEANPLVRAGIEDEAKAIRHVEESQGTLLLPICAEAEAYPLLRASFDGLTEANEPVEIKCPHETTYLDVLLNQEQAEAYQLYWCQVQHQLLVSEASRGYLYFYHAGQTVKFEIQRDEVFIKALITTAQAFWLAVTTRTEPLKDPDRDLFLPQGLDIKTWQQLAADYRKNQAKLLDLKNHIERLNAVQDSLEQQLVALMGDYRTAEHSGVRVSRFQVQGPVDYKTALQALAPTLTEDSLSPYRKKASERVRITCRSEDSPRIEVPFNVQVLNTLAGTDYWF